MKHSRLFLLGIACLTLIGLASCLGDSTTYNGLSRAEKAKCLAAVKGDYTGKMIYQARNPADINDTQDTVDVRWTITADSTFILHEFPTVVLAEYIYDENVKEALLEQEPIKDLTGPIGFTLLTPYVEYVIAPQRLEMPVFYNGSTHTLTVIFWVNSSSFGITYETTRETVVRLNMAAAYIDENTGFNLFNNYTTDPVNIPMLLFNKEE